MSDIRINVGANTEEAKRSFANLGKHIDETQKKANNFSVNSTDSKLNTGPEFASKANDNVDALADAIKKLNENLTNINRSNTSSRPNLVGGDGSNSTGNLFGNLTKGGAIIGAARGAYNFVKGGASSAAMYEKQALDTYNRLGIYGSDFNKARKGATNLGKQYGFDTSQVMGLQDTLLQGGFRGQKDLDDSSKAMMETNLAFGINANSLGSDYANLKKRGLYDVDAEKYTNTIGTNIAATNMKGREDEVARSLADITDIITNGKLEVNSSDFEMAASLQAQLAKQNPALKGDKGAELLNKIQGGFNSSDHTTQRLFGMGNQLGYGLEGLKQAKKFAEDGLSNPEGMKIFYENLKRETGGNRTLQELYLSQTMGTKVSESEEILKLLESGTSGDYQKIKEKYGDGGDKQKNIDTARDSKSFANTQYELNKEAASLDIGNKLNETTVILKDIYNAMPSGVQGVTSLAGATVAGATGGAVIGSIPKLLFGGAKDGSLFKGLGEGAGSLGKASKFVGENAGKLTKYGKVATGIGVGIEAVSSGVEAYKHFKKGETREGYGSIGSGAGSIAGGLAGAAIGSALIPIPGLGTIVGGSVGSFIGDKVGGAIGKSLAPSDTHASESRTSHRNQVSRYFESDKSRVGKASQSKERPKVGRKPIDNKAYESESHFDKKNKDLVTRKESILRREEQLVDRLEAGDLFKINVDNGNKENKKPIENKTNLKKSEYAENRERYYEGIKNGTINPTGVDGISGAADTSSSSTSKAPLVGRGNSEKIWNYFKKQGFSDAGTAGIMANLYHESGYDPSIKQIGGGPGRGLAQWGGPRFTALQNFARDRSKPWTDMQTQLDFLMHEMKTNHNASFIESFKTSTNAYNSAATFENVFERPKYNHNAQRGATANNIFNQRDQFNTPSKASESEETTKKSNISSYAVGIDRVPEDQLAFLHKDETVLNKFDARNYRETVENNNTSTGTINLNLTITAEEKAQGLTEEIKQAILLALKQLEGKQTFKLNQAYQRAPR